VTPAFAGRLGEAATLPGSPEDGEVAATTRAIGRTLDGPNLYGDYGVKRSLILLSLAR